MVDIKNLNRVNGILSAKQGTEIPKFQNPAGPIAFDASDPGFQQFIAQNNLLSNAQSWNEYQRLKRLDPKATVEQLGSYYNGTATPPAQVTATSIPGVNPAEGNPNVAAEKSASQNEITQQLQQQEAAKTAASYSPPPLQLEPTKLNMQPANLELPQNINGLSLESEMNIASNLQNMQGSKGMQMGKGMQTGQAQSQIVSGISQGIGAIGSAVNAKQKMSDSDTTKSVDTAYDGIANAAANFGPWGQIISVAMKAAGVVGDTVQAMGGGTDQQTKTDQWMDSAFFSWNIGMLNGFAGKNTQDFSVDQDIMASVGSSYGGAAADFEDAASKAGKKYGLFSTKARKKADKAIADAKNKQSLMGSIADEATDQRLAAQSMGEQAGLAYSMMTSGGYDQKYTYAAKHGGLLEWNPSEILEWEPQVELVWELPEFKKGGSIDIIEELEWVPELKKGGKTLESDVPETEETNQKNVIPEGALHKNKHHMEHAEGLTKKGIPVIDDGGEQQAEIEHSEIIFTLEVTKKLEEYYDIFYSEESSNKEKEQAAIDAGKLLVYQILENTEDRTGLIESCKKGGSLTLKKTTDDLIEEVLEWTPTLVIVEETEVVEKPKKLSEKKSDKDVMKKAIKEVLIELLTK